MKPWQWVVLAVVAVAAFLLGRYLSTLQAAYTNRDKISGLFEGADAIAKLTS